MKVVAFNGSAQKNGNTATLINGVFQALQKENIDTELIQLAGTQLRGCTACMKCFENLDQRCILKNDDLNTYLEKMREADGIILGSPTYFTNVSAEMKALIDRAGLVAIANGHMFKRKAGAAVVAMRRAGGVQVFDAINHFFLINQFVVPGSIYWNLGVGLQKGEVEQDQEALITMRILGENMAWVIKNFQ